MHFQRYQRFVGTNPEQEVAQQGAHLHAERERGQGSIRDRVCEPVLPVLCGDLCPYMLCYIIMLCTGSLLFSVYTMSCEVSLFFSALYAKCPYYDIVVLINSVFSL